MLHYLLLHLDIYFVPFHRGCQGEFKTMSGFLVNAQPFKDSSKLLRNLIDILVKWATLPIAD